MGMTAWLFLAFVAITVAMAAVVVARFRGRRAAAGVSISLSAWCAYVGVVGYSGLARNATMRPPGIAFIGVPVAVYLALLFLRAGSSSGARTAASFPMWTLLGLQSFRIGVELFLHRLWIDGIVPRTLTFHGANIDIYIGASAPLIAWWSARGRLSAGVAVAWNGVGLLALANVVARSVLTAPGPLNLVHAEVPNRMMGAFPYVFIPGLFVPLAVTLHVLSLRAVTLRPGDEHGPRPHLRST